MILKAGTYKWNDVLTYQGFDLQDEFLFNFVIGDSTSTAQCTGIDLFVSEDVIYIDGYLPNLTHPTIYDDGYWHEIYGDVVKTITIETDQIVTVAGYEDDEEYINEIIPAFINFFIANTNYNEVNAKPLAEITYNGETIAQLNAGETATLSCEGMKMASDVVVKVNKGSNGNVVPLVVTQNGTYTYTYETATETIDVNTQWEFIMPETNDIVGFKKATNFIVPKSIEEVSSKLFYMTVPQEDGTIKSSPFDEIAQEEGFVFANMVLMCVGDATPLNEAYGTTYFENNTVYLTNAIWITWIFAGVAIEEMPPITITFASKLIENASFYPVTVDVEPNLEFKAITTNGTHIPSQGKDGFSSVTVDVPAKVTVTNLPTGNADADDVYEMDGALYKLNTNVLTGAWTMSTDPNVVGIHNSNSYEVNFTSNGVEYTGFGYMYDNIDYKLYYQGPNGIEVYNTAKGWLNDSYRYIEITGENENVLAWLNNNGSKKTSGEWVEYIKPEGTLELVFNNIEAEFPIDCSQYAKVTVNTAEPLKISDPTVLDNITDSPWGVGGNVFLYEGATTDSYENGALYYLEDTEK